MSTPVTTSFNSWGKPVSQANAVRSHRRGRICAHEGCKTILSIYNPAEFCAAHMNQAQNRHGRVAEHPMKEAACKNCGSIFATDNPHRRYCSDRCRVAAFSRRKRSAQQSVARREALAVVWARPSESEVPDDAT